MKKLRLVVLNVFLAISMLFPFSVNVSAAEKIVLTAKVGRDSGIQLEWTSSEDVAKYTILRKRDDGYYSGLATRESKYGLNYLDASNLEVGKEYTYKVRYTKNGINIDSNEVTIKCESTEKADNEFENKQDATEYLKKELVKRNKDINIIFNASSFPSGLMQEMYENARIDLEESSSNSAIEGDYLRYTIKPGTIKFTSGIDGKVGDLTSYTFNFKLDYYTSSAQEQAVNNKVVEILNTFKKQGIDKNSNVYDKCKAVYDYLATNLHYNNQKNPDTGELMITAYDSLVRKEAQCYGQTMGAYRLLKELGVVTRRVDGKLKVDGKDINHGWNIVLVDGKWYNFDATYPAAYYEDTGNITYRGFLKTYDFFIANGYTLGADYSTTSDFGKKHPYGSVVYESEPTAPSDLILDNLDNGNIKATFPKVTGADGYALFRSTEANGKFVNVKESNTNTIIDDTTVSGTTYHYKVKSYKNINGYKIYSSAYSGRREIRAEDLNNAYFEEIKITAIPLNHNSVKITWNKAIGVSYYQVYRSISKNGNYALLGTFDEDTTEKVSSSLVTGQTYYYKVRGYRWINGKRVYSPYSNIVSATPEVRMSTPKLKSVTERGYNSLNINWEKADGVSYYQVYRSTSPNGKYALLGTYDENTTSSISRALIPNQTYYYKVRGYCWANGERVFTRFSNIISGTPKMKAPTLKSVEPNTYNSLRINWEKAEGSTLYQVYRSTSPNGKYALLGTFDEDTTEKISTSLVTGQTYYYKVRGYRWVNGNRVFTPFSNILSGTPKLEAPTLKSVEPNTYDSLKINWEKADGAQYYQVYRSTYKTWGYRLLGTYDETTTSSLSRKLGARDTYYYKVRSYRWVNGERVFSDYSNILTGKTRLPAPKATVSSNTSSSLKVSWEKVEGATYYQVYRSTSANGNYVQLGTYDSDTTTKISTSLAKGKTYYYKVRCYRWVRGNRQFSPFSEVVSMKA